MELNETKSAIVTGGASGLGAAVARRLAAAFVQVSIFDTNADQGRVFAEQIGGRFHAVDVSDAASVAQGMAEVKSAQGGLDVLVNCAGIEKLKNAGCEVLVGVLEQEAQEINKRFFTFHLKKRPYIILKWAQSTDGFIAPLKKNRSLKEPVWLSNESSQTYSHLWRAQEQSILVGVQTVIDDNPSLTTRKVQGNSPLRIVLDPQGRIPEDSNVLSDEFDTLIFSTKKSATTKEVVISDFKKPLDQLCTFLHQKNIQSLIVEGGSKTLQGFIDSDLWDEARIFTSPKVLNEGIKKPILKGKQKSSSLIEGDRLEIVLSNLEKEY